MFDAIFGRSVKILKLLAKVQCVLAFVLASMLCGAVHEMLKPINRFSAIVLGLVVAVVFWVLQMFLAWALYAFAELVEYTKETHKELSNMSEGLARYTQATYEELHSMNKGLEAYTKAMGKTMNSMNKNLYLVAKHCCAEEERARAAARPQSGNNNKEIKRILTYENLSDHRLCRFYRFQLCALYAQKIPGDPAGQSG